MTPPTTSGALLRQLGKPASWRASPTPADLLGDTIRRASARARTLALGDGPDQGEDSG
jgi:hypothetical protein